MADNQELVARNAPPRRPRHAARDDPTSFVDHDGLLVIGEVQLAPELFRAIKVAVDTDPRPGRFLLTGSARILALRDLPDPLPGRADRDH